MDDHARKSTSCFQTPLSPALSEVDSERSDAEALARGLAGRPLAEILFGVSASPAQQRAAPWRFCSAAVAPEAFPTSTWWRPLS